MTTSTPALLTLAEGLRLIDGLGPQNPFEIDARLGDLLERILATPPSLSTAFTLLEAMRPVLLRTLEKKSGEYRAKLVPLETDQQQAFQQTIQRLRQMTDACTLAAGGPVEGEDPVRSAQRQAIMQQRALSCIGQELFEHYVARQEVPEGTWLRLNQTFDQVERHGLAETPVDDSRENTPHQTHCLATYVSALLIEMASPYAQTLHHLDMIRRWATQWAALTSLHTLDDDLESPPFLIRLDQDKPLHLADPLEVPDRRTRHLDTTRLGQHINHLLDQLQTNIRPALLGLGEEPAYQVRPLLSRLRRPWTQAVASRKFRRFPTQAEARAVTGFASMHFAVLGKHFIQPDRTLGYSRAAVEGLYTYGDQAGKMPEAGHYGHPVVAFEPWQVLNHSANGFRLLRTAAGCRLTLGQSIAVCPHDGEQFLICRINWLMEETDGSLLLGASILGGLPAAVSLRPAGSTGRYDLCFTLASSPATGENPSLILPTGVYLPQAEFELLEGDKSSRIRLRQIIEQGIDFDRVAFESV